jgi:hypothetical protein
MSGLQMLLMQSSILLGQNLGAIGGGQNPSFMERIE